MPTATPIAASLFLGLGACALLAPAERMRVERLTNEIFPSKASPSDVEILPDDGPKAFVSIARIRIQGKPGGSMTALFEELQEEAAALGADAVVRLRTGWRMGSGTGFSQGLQQDYGLPPGATPSDASGSSRIPWAIGLAVKYERRAESR